MPEPNLDEAAIFELARQIPDPKIRGEYVEQVCGNQTALKVRVGELLRALDEEPGFLSGAPIETDETVAPIGLEERPGMTLGNYKVMEKIGEGGFGVVFVAEQQRPVRRKVALKVIKPGMDTKEVIARFEAERQALALMDHPNIAKVLDAGTTESGRPYFVMELVRGVAINDYCDRKKLGTKERLELFILVCQAMQHAHQKGVIHRDVKPSNVLITEHDGKPVPKVIDFGVAKAIHQRLTEKTIYTRHHQIVGTPLYMSPEQAEFSGLDIDTRTDIYSLGVLLYELLTGTTPISRQRMNEAVYDEIRRMIREEDPPKPSTRVSTLGDDAKRITECHSDSKRLEILLRGDLDWIVMKSIDKDRSRRYETASAFADDIRRHLTNEPVMASPPNVAYRVRKFVRRNRGFVLAASAVAAALVIGFSAALYAFLREAEQAQNARVSAADAKLAQSRAEGEKDKARLATAASVAAAARAKIDRDKALEAKERAQVATDVAEQHLLLLTSMLNSNNAWMRTQSDWLSSSTSEAFDAQGLNYTVRDMLDDFSDSLRKRNDVSPEVGVEIWDVIAGAYNNLGEYQESREANSQSIELGRKAFEDDPKSLSNYLFRYVLKIMTSGNENWVADAQLGETLVREAIDLRRELESDTGNGGPPCHFYIALAQMQFGQGLLANSESSLETARQIYEKANEDVQIKTWIDATHAMALMMNDENRSRETIEYSDVVMELLTDKPNDLKYNMAVICKGQALMDELEMAQADAFLEKYLSTNWKTNGRNYPDQSVETVDVNYLAQRMKTLRATGNLSEAYRILEGSLETCRKAETPVAETQLLVLYADLLFVDGRIADAIAELERGAEIAFVELGPQHASTNAILRYLGPLYELECDRERADAVYLRMLPLVEKAVAETDRNPIWLVPLALAKSHASKSSKRDLQEALAAANEGLKNAIRPLRHLLYLAKAKALDRLGHVDEAVVALREGVQQRTHVDLGWIPLEQMLFEVLDRENRLDELEEEMRRFINLRRRYLSPQHPATLAASTRYASWLLDQGRMSDAEPWMADCQTLANDTNANERYKQLAIQILARANRNALDETKEHE